MASQSSALFSICVNKLGTCGAFVDYTATAEGLELYHRDFFSNLPPLLDNLLLLLLDELTGSGMDAGSGKTLIMSSCATGGGIGAGLLRCIVSDPMESIRSSSEKRAVLAGLLSLLLVWAATEASLACSATRVVSDSAPRLQLREYSLCVAVVIAGVAGADRAGLDDVGVRPGSEVVED